MNHGRHELGALAWSDVLTKPVVIVPVGSTEQHGPHLPVDTDTVVATSVATALAEAIANGSAQQVVVAPAVSYGASGEHQSFPGTMSIGLDALRILLVELVRSLATWSGRIILINAHGGNLAALVAAVRQLRAEQHDVVWMPCLPENGDLHAGRSETSLMLHLRPHSVRMERSERGEIRPLADILPQLKAEGVRSVSPTGVLGDPSGATAEEGRYSLQTMLADTLNRLSNDDPDKNGMLAPNRHPSFEKKLA